MELFPNGSFSHFHGEVEESRSRREPPRRQTRKQIEQLDRHPKFNNTTESQENNNIMQRNTSWNWQRAGGEHWCERKENWGNIKPVTVSVFIEINPPLKPMSHFFLTRSSRLQQNFSFTFEAFLWPTIVFLYSVWVCYTLLWKDCWRRGQIKKQYFKMLREGLICNASRLTVLTYPTMLRVLHCLLLGKKVDWKDLRHDCMFTGGFKLVLQSRAINGQPKPQPSVYK